MLSWKNLAALLATACLLAAGNALVNPQSPPWTNDTLQPGEIQMATLQAAASNILWVDARRTGTPAIPDSIVLGDNAFDDILPELLSRWQAGAFIVVVSESGENRSAHTMAERLRKEVGLDNVYVLKGGADAWRSAGQ